MSTTTKLVKFLDPSLGYEVTVSVDSILDRIEENSKLVISQSQNKRVYEMQIETTQASLIERGYPRDFSLRPLMKSEDFYRIAKENFEAIDKDFEDLSKTEKKTIVENEKTLFTEQYYAIRELKNKIQECIDDANLVGDLNARYLSIIPESFYSFVE